MVLRVPEASALPFACLRNGMAYLAGKRLEVGEEEIVKVVCSRDRNWALQLLLSAGIFAGAMVSGLAGFAFSAVAGAVVLHILPPTEAVPLMMACSIITQAVSLVALRGTIAWRGSIVLIIGGVIGAAPALYLLHSIDARTLRFAFGAFLALYAAWMLFRPAAARAGSTPGRLRHAIVGLGGGLIGGLTAMPGALPTIWCDLRGMPKDQQRGLVQPFIMAMQVLALAFMLSHNALSSAVLLQLALSLPALAADAMLGIMVFRRVSDALFRRIVLSLLLVAGLIFVV
jgi:uncharacterized protein